MEKASCLRTQHSASSDDSHVYLFFLASQITRCPLSSSLINTCMASSLLFPFMLLYYYGNTVNDTNAIIDDYLRLFSLILNLYILTPDRRQSKGALNNRRTWLKIDRNSVFDCHLSPLGRQMAIESSVSNDFLSTFIDSINVFDCRLSGAILLTPKREH